MFIPLTSPLATIVIHSSFVWNCKCCLFYFGLHHLYTLRFETKLSLILSPLICMVGICSRPAMDSSPTLQRNRWCRSIHSYRNATFRTPMNVRRTEAGVCFTIHGFFLDCLAGVTLKYLLIFHLVPSDVWCRKFSHLRINIDIYRDKAMVAFFAICQYGLSTRCYYEILSTVAF